MAARPGEENVATLFGDIHYLYGPPDTKPRHHRFDKGSYVYLFENAGERRCRIEIANYPGTEDQDAFFGFLDQTHVRYSYKHHCMVSLTVADAVDQSEWHLPTYDPRNENKYHYKLHSLDAYFWTQQDALQFVNGVRRVLPPSQVEVMDEPAPPPQAAGMSSVVQQLERAAISDPQYGAGASTTSQHPPLPQGAAMTASPEAPGAVPPPPPPQGNFVPMAYNPAAPAAPETIRHREKTPPLDDDPLNPLAVAVAHDYHKQPFTPGLPPASQPGGGPGVASPGMPPPQQPAMQRAMTMPRQAGLASPFGPSPNSFPASPRFAPAGLTQTTSQPTPPITGSGMPPPPGGYSGYPHGPQTPSGAPGQDYSIHQQVYRPSEADSGPTPHQYQPKQEPRGKLEENAGRLERGVTGMLKKFEKKFG
ncbi:hypothetical protein HRG_011013 [Hirsutella rhossiliensis]|uniref:RNA recognition motif-containing protein n=1 Tax=Hirsutella rhossiliensis TaxID=111463 RepID=A0A9P8SE15_9HYPO|nr:uncharacterized protein HRG_11013 [Hirsutella rhossiliensis]KAH0957920.1 hypothetical protein HRG_11013 [Hirsutella rhossiliensis]